MKFEADCVIWTALPTLWGYVYVFIFIIVFSYLITYFKITFLNKIKIIKLVTRTWMSKLNRYITAKTVRFGLLSLETTYLRVNSLLSFLVLAVRVYLFILQTDDQKEKHWNAINIAINFQVNWSFVNHTNNFN